MYWYKFQYFFWSCSRDQNHKVPPQLKHERLGGVHGDVVAPPKWRPSVDLWCVHCSLGTNDGHWYLNGLPSPPNSGDIAKRTNALYDVPLRQSCSLAVPLRVLITPKLTFIHISHSPRGNTISYIPSPRDRAMARWPCGYTAVTLPRPDSTRAPLAKPWPSQH